MPVQSPCTGICRLDPEDGFCMGCRRNVEEIAAWSTMNDSQRREVLAVIIKRQKISSPKNQTPSP